MCIHTKEKEKQMNLQERQLDVYYSLTNIRDTYDDLSMCLTKTKQIARAIETRDKIEGRLFVLRRYIFWLV